VKFSPDGLHLLGGVGDGRIYIDGVIPDVMRNFHAGGWDWLDNETIVGGGSPDDTKWSVWSYNLVTQVLKQVDERPSSWVYASGSGKFAVYLASNPPLSYDSLTKLGDEWKDRAAFAMSPEGDEVFTNFDHNILLVRSAAGTETHYETGPVFNAQMQGGVLFWCGIPTILHAVGAPSPKCPQSGGVNAVFTTLQDGRRFIVQWDSAINALVVYEWISQTVSGALMGYTLSFDGLDFNHDITQRTTDGMLLVGTGVNQGETGQRLYELDLTNSRVRRNGGLWSPLVLSNLDTPPVVLPTIEAFDHDVWVAPYFPDKTAPGNACIVANNQDYRTDAPDTSMIIASPTALAVAVPPKERFLGIYNETRSGITIALAEQYDVPLFVCQDSPGQFDPGSLAKLRSKDWPLLECYLLPDETVEQSYQRWLANLTQLLSDWEFNVGLAWQDYMQLWKVTPARLAQAHNYLGRLVNLDKRVALVAPFAWKRPDGCVGPPWIDPNTGIYYYPSSDLATCVKLIAAASPGIPSEAPMVLQIPQVQVDSFTLDELKNGKEFVGHDPQNPSIATRCRVWVENGSIYMEISYPGLGPTYVGKTGKYRAVK
jgi:hypothetical protein